MRKYLILLIIGVPLYGCASLFSNSDGDDVTGYNDARNSCNLMLQARKNVPPTATVTPSYITYQSYLAVLLGQQDAITKKFPSSQYEFEAQAQPMTCGPMLKEPKYCSDVYNIYSESYQKQKDTLKNYDLDTYKQGFERGLNECQRQMSNESAN